MSQRKGFAAGLFLALAMMGANGFADDHGRIWRRTYDLEQKRTVTQTIDAKGNVTTLGPGPSAPWPDGTAYAFDNWDSEYTLLQIFYVEQPRPLRQIRFKGLFRDVFPAPSAAVIAVRSSYSTLGPFTWEIIDLAKAEFLQEWAADGSAFAWLSANSFMTISASGEIRHGSIGRAPTPRGRVQLPAGRVVSAMWLNPQQSQMILRLDQSKERESDLWIADFDGSNLERFTETQMATIAAWSPDGKRIAFEVDTGSWCAGYHCTGICEVWEAPATARSVRANRESRDIRYLTEMSSGRKQQMECSLLGWTK